MNNIYRICALPTCDQPIRDWRKQFCCRSHAAIYGSGKESKQTREEHLAYHRAWSLDKQKRIRLATPIWANKDKIGEIYLEAANLSRTTGIIHEVDHIIPLTNKLVCGLHVESNLQILTISENRAKRNKFIIE